MEAVEDQIGPHKDGQCSNTEKRFGAKRVREQRRGSFIHDFQVEKKGGDEPVGT